MEICNTIVELRDKLKNTRAREEKIGFVPTMGALHEGHISLVRESKRVADFTVVSIFVNPIQFNNPEDYNAYPITINEDLDKLRDGGVDAVFVPNQKEIYPNQTTMKIDLGNVANKLEGEFRPGHFNGVGLVVLKLLNIIQPDSLFLGLKDLQQYLLLKEFIKTINLPVNVIGVETVRDATGLALSSRNMRLSTEGKLKATVINQVLRLCEKMIKSGENLNRIKKTAIERIGKEEGVELEYLKIIDPYSFDEIETFDGSAELAVCIAAYVEGIRLIDNLYLPQILLDAN